jgi:hypothetical protein
VVRTPGRDPVSAPVTGSDSQWYESVLKTPTIRLAPGGTEYSARATPLTDATKVDEVVESFPAEYRARDVEAYYAKHDVAVEIALA